MKAPVAKRMFELYASGRHSLSALRTALKSEFGVTLGKSHLEKLLKNPFYSGVFQWQGKFYNGTHQPLVDRAVFDQAQDVFQGFNKPKYRRHDFAFGGLLNCAYDGCTIPAEIKKQKYIYYLLHWPSRKL
jgi:site-specific DNA recombinase